MSLYYTYMYDINVVSVHYCVYTVKLYTKCDMSTLYIECPICAGMCSKVCLSLAGNHQEK